MYFFPYQCFTIDIFVSSFDNAMQSLKATARNTADELSEVFTEMRAHLYLYSGTLLLKMAHEKEHQWRAVVHLAAFCYLLAYQVRLGPCFVRFIMNFYFCNFKSLLRGESHAHHD